jgi:hypothetical protein
MAAKTKKAPVVEEVEDDMELVDDDAEVEDDESEAAPAKSKVQEVTFGVSDLAKHLSGVTGKTITPRELRTQIRRMAREDSPRVSREITAGNRTRYDWPDGLKDPEVKRIIKAVTGGELEEGKKAALQALKDKKAAQGPKTGKKGKKTKPAKVTEVEDDIEEIDEDDLEVDEDDE